MLNADSCFTIFAAVKTAEETGLEDWPNQAPGHLHATIFAATALTTNNPAFADWAHYVPRAMQCMCDALDTCYAPGPQLRIVMYLPAADA